jgi:AcrR family transcriptional regulator
VAHVIAPSRGQETRRRVLENALALFSEQGYDATPLQAIADRLQLSKAALYYYFPSKTSILEALLEPGQAALVALLDAAEAEPSHEQRAATVVRGFVERALIDRHTLAAFRRDPAVQRHPTYVRQAALVHGRLERLLFGPTPTPHQRAALQLSLGLSEAVLKLPDLSDDQLREALLDVTHRVLDMPRSPVSPVA